MSEENTFKLIPYFKDLIKNDPGILIWIILLISLFVGALVSKFLISLSIFLMIPTIFFLVTRNKGRIAIERRTWRDFIINQNSQLLFGLFILFFIVTLGSALFSENLNQGFHKVQLRIPYFILPFIFVCNKPLKTYDIYVFLWVCICISALVSLGVIANYLIQFDLITETLSYGKAIPTPSNHIRYSLFLSFLSLTGIYLLSSNRFKQKSYEQIALITSALVLIASLHILAVRSGLFLFYLGIFYLLIVIFYNRVRKRVIFTMVLIAGLIPFLAYHFIPSLENRIDYMIYDIQRYYEGDLGTYSDGDRFRSIQMGLKLFKENIWLGCGIGDIHEATNEIYKQHIPEVVNVKHPHNQLVFFLATTGIIGTLLSLPAFFLPYFFYNFKERIILHLHGIVFLISCVFEATIEGTNGICFHLLFVLLLINHNRTMASS
jgi:O-antigen ligase